MGGGRPTGEPFLTEAAPLPAGGLEVRFGGDRPTTLRRSNLLKLEESIDSWESRKDLRWIAFTSAGGTFLAGADFSELAPLTGAEAFEFSLAGTRLSGRMKRSRLWLVACPAGACMGGGLDFLMACDYRIASPKAFLGHPGPRLGLITGWGGTASLPRRSGAGIPALLAGRRFDADEALKAGFIEEVAEDPLEAACRRAARSASLNLALVKEISRLDALPIAFRLRLERLSARVNL